MTEYHGVMIYGEMVEGKLATITKELLGCGRTLAKVLGEDLIAVFVGSHVWHLADETIQFGADKVMVVDETNRAEAVDSWHAALENRQK